MRAPRAMTGAVRENPAVEGLRSLEVRWILPGLAGAAMAEWFARFPAEEATREDSYLLDPAVRGLSVKMRAGRALDVKVYHGSPGILRAPGGAVGRTESWRKWSFPVGRLSGPDGGGPDGWTVVRKRRRISRFWLASGRIEAGSPRRATEAACAVELTDVCSGGAAWWSLGFEAIGPATALRAALEGTAGVVFGQPPPSGAELSMSRCQSYAEWLFRSVNRARSGGITSRG